MPTFISTAFGLIVFGPGTLADPRWRWKVTAADGSTFEGITRAPDEETAIRALSAGLLPDVTIEVHPLDAKEDR